MSDGTYEALVHKQKNLGLREKIQRSEEPPAWRGQNSDRLPTNERRIIFNSSEYVVCPRADQLTATEFH